MTCKIGGLAFYKTRLIGLFFGGERGIRTLEGSFPPYSLSRRAPSASSAISPLSLMAEGVGFEPTELFTQRFSRPSP